MADATPTQVVQQQQGFAPELAPYAQSLLGSAFGNVFSTTTDPNTGQPTITGFQPYMQYTGDRFAQFSPLQQQSFTAAQGMQTSPLLDQAATATLGATAGAAKTGQYQPGTFGTQSFTAPGVAQQYMNPYMQQVLAPQLQAMQRQADTQRNMIGAQAAQAGAFGGARSGLMNSQLNAELMRQQQQATGAAYGQAYQQGANQFNTEQQARQAAAQLGEQSRQYGAGLGLQGLQTALQGAGQLGSLGQTAYGQQMGIANLQNQYGGQQQQQMQNILNQQYQDFLNAQNMPYKQMGFLSDILRGVPLTQTGAAMYQAPPSTMATVAGLGSIAKGTGLLGGKQGGLPVNFKPVSNRPAGLAELAIHNMGR